MTQFTFTGTLHISTIAAGSVEEHWAVEAYQDEEVHKQEPDHWEVGVAYLGEAVDQAFLV